MARRRSSSGVAVKSDRWRHETYSLKFQESQFSGNTMSESSIVELERVTVKRRPYTHYGTKSFYITLIRPPAVCAADAVNISSLTPPLALAYLSGFLRKAGYSVTNIDSIGEGIDEIHSLQRNPNMEAQGLSVGEILLRIPEETDLIGVSCMFSLEWPATRDLILQVRTHFPRIPIVVGGEHATALPEFCLKECRAIDFIVLGEGELILNHLVEALHEGKSTNGIPGILSRSRLAGEHGSGYGRASPSSRIDGASGIRFRDLDELPWAAWDLTPIQAYLDRKMTFGRYVGLTMPIVGSRGCPYECTFCSSPSMWGRRYLTRSPADVVDEILFYKAKYGIDAVEFYDLTPIIKKSWIIEFCDELIRRDAGIKWQISGGTRCEAIDEEVIIRSKQAGCGYLGFAPESGVQEVLDRIKKRIKLPHLLELIRLAQKHGVDTRCNIVIGFPDDSRYEIYRSLVFQLRLAYLGVVDVPIFDFTPYPGSELFERLLNEGIIQDLKDGYFESLGMNIQVRNRRRYCRRVGPLELMLYRIIGMTGFYALYYLLRPAKLLGFFSNILSYRRSNSVFEQRIIQNIHKQTRKLGRHWHDKQVL